MKRKYIDRDDGSSRDDDGNNGRNNIRPRREESYRPSVSNRPVHRDEMMVDDDIYYDDERNVANNRPRRAPNFGILSNTNPIIENIASFGRDLGIANRRFANTNELSPSNAKPYNDYGKNDLEMLMIFAEKVGALSLSNPNIDDTKLKLLKNLPNLNKLVLENCQKVTGSTFDYIPISIEELVIKNCAFLAEESMIMLERLKKLKKLSLHSCQITGRKFGFLPENIESITLVDCRNLEDNALEKLYHISALKRLVIEDAPITGFGFDQFPSMLEELSVRRCSRLESEAITNLTYAKNLRILSIEMSETFTGRYTTCFTLLPDSLKELTITAKGLYDKNIEDFRHLTNLKRLLLKGCSNITGASSFKSLPKGLEELQVISCESFPDSGIESLHELPNLKKLTLIDLRLIEGLSFSSLPEQLKELVCIDCEGIRDAGVKGLEHLKKLNRLSISNALIVGSTLGLLPKSIEELDLIMCPGLTDNGLKHIHELTALKRLVVTGGIKITSASLNSLPSGIETAMLVFFNRPTDEEIENLHRLKHLKRLDLNENQHYESPVRARIMQLYPKLKGNF